MPRGHESITDHKKADENRSKQTLMRRNEGFVEQNAVQTTTLDEAVRRLRNEIAALPRGDAHVHCPVCEDFRNGARGGIEQLIAALVHELNQHLAAASFLVTAAGLRLEHAAGEGIAAAREDLDEATTQILRVGQIIRGLRNHFGGEEADVEANHDRSRSGRGSKRPQVGERLVRKRGPRRPIKP